MRRLFVFIKCDLQKTYEVADYIMDEIEETGEILSVSGDWDLLCRFNLSEDEDIGRFVTDVVQAVPHIRDTSTLIGFRLFDTRDRLSQS